MVELIVTMIIVVVLAAVAMPRFMARPGFDSRGFYDQAQAVARYAQKNAVSERRAVFVIVTAGSVAACYDAGCASPVANPSTGAPLVVVAPSGASIGPVTTFSFNGLGKPSLGAALSLTVAAAGDISRTFVVENETGYVHPSP